ncbi:MAG: 16S rRNA (guanine(527)-N(7))-methyltransferase RsmG [Candidatus Gracilibacteria bacterium]|nr:16S rRNA (guanine(527)-N(7))-methyltransferase RsmG [Candidatus Gracilibacteria bacterium]
MNELFNKYEIELNEFQENKFREFLNIFIETNSQINLSAIRDEENIILKHFIDSVLILKEKNLYGKVMDIGTGGGFPGIPLSIMTQNKDVEYVLVDSVQKKIKVVNDFIEKLELKNIKAISGRAEDLGREKDLREQFDFVVSRAMAYLPTLLEYVSPFLKVGGIFISYKLDNPGEIEEATKALDVFNCEVIKTIEYELEGQKRIFLLIQKIGPTAKKFPRKVGEPKNFPII